MKATTHSPSESTSESADSSATAPVADHAEALSDKTARLQDDIGHLVADLSEQVAELAREAQRIGVEKGGAAQDALAALADECALYVRQKPVQSVAIAAAAGALLALLFGRRH
jgi:ElaB/YqjD/DUF883 family membrane-anchored ribosome-binding protein